MRCSLGTHCVRTQARTSETCRQYCGSPSKALSPRAPEAFNSQQPCSRRGESSVCLLWHANGLPEVHAVLGGDMHRSGFRDVRGSGFGFGDERVVAAIRVIKRTILEQLQHYGVLGGFKPRARNFKLDLKAEQNLETHSFCRNLSS